MRGKFVLAPNGDQLVPSCLSVVQGLYRGCRHFRESVQRGLTVVVFIIIIKNPTTLDKILLVIGKESSYTCRKLAATAT